MASRTCAAGAERQEGPRALPFWLGRGVHATNHPLRALRDPTGRMELALQGVFAGNIFDLGSAETAELFASGGAAFASTRTRLLPRPRAAGCEHDEGRWLDRLAQVRHAAIAVTSAWRAAGLGWGGGKGVAAKPCSGPECTHVAAPCHALTTAQGPYRKAILFVDNAGSDIVLGMLPLARELLKQGTRVRGGGCWQQLLPPSMPPCKHCVRHASDEQSCCNWALGPPAKPVAPHVQSVTLHVRVCVPGRPGRQRGLQHQRHHCR